MFRFDFHGIFSNTFPAWFRNFQTTIFSAPSPTFSHSFAFLSFIARYLARCFQSHFCLFSPFPDIFFLAHACSDQWAFSYLFQSSRTIFTSQTLFKTSNYFPSHFSMLRVGFFVVSGTFSNFVMSPPSLSVSLFHHRSSKPTVVSRR